MTTVPPKAPPPKAPVTQNKSIAAASSAAKAIKKKKSFFSREPVTIDYVADEDGELARTHRLQGMLFTQSVAIVALTITFVFLQPVLKPFYHYYSRDPAGNVTAIDPLMMPNMTNRAVLSWAVTGVTEVMTFGFGDIITQLALQRPRFTGEGWTSFVDAFHRQRINETFKENQLVLTTVPSDTAIILAQGPNESGIYQWKVQVPVIMTYATSNNTPHPHRSVVTLTIVRVKPDQNPSGIAIKHWAVDR